jgi:hypothetical protein
MFFKYDANKVQLPVFLYCYINPLFIYIIYILNRMIIMHMFLQHARMFTSLFNVQIRQARLSCKNENNIKSPRSYEN